MKNYYVILGIPPSASADEIRVAYRLNAKRYHPDLNPDNESYKKRFLEIRDAYEILSNPESRAKYDRELSGKERQGKTGATATATATAANAATANPHAFSKRRARYTHEPVTSFDSDANAAAQPTNKKEEAKVAKVREQVLKRRHALLVQQLNEEHEVKLELARVTAREELLKYKKATNKKLDAFRKKMLADRKKMRDRYRKAIDGFARKLFRYKQNIKQSIYHKGLKDGMRSAQDSARRAMDELKAAAGSDRAMQNTRVDDLQEELTLIAQKNEALQAQIELLERLSAAENSDCDRAEQIAAQAVQENADAAIVAERDAALVKVQEYEMEIEDLNDEILRLAAMLDSWKVAAADGVVTEDELATIRAYEDGQLQKSKGTLYGTLGLYLNALPEEIDRAYERLSRRYMGKDEYLERFMEINDAYEILSDPKQKTAYDAQIGNLTEI